MYKEVLASRLRSARRENNLTQEQVSKKLKINQSTISGYEKGYREPDIETFARLAVLYCHTLDYFVGLADD